MTPDHQRILSDARMAAPQATDVMALILWIERLSEINAGQATTIRKYMRNREARE